MLSTGKVFVSVCTVFLFLTFAFAQPQTRLYDDPKIVEWSAFFLENKLPELLQSVEKDLRSPAPHPFAAHVWTVAQASSGKTNLSQIAAPQDTQINRALGDLPAIYELYHAGQYKILLTKYPTAQTKQITDVWILHYLAQAAYEQARFREMLNYTEAMARLQPNHFQAAWLTFNAAERDERLRPEVEKIAKSKEFADTAFGRFLSQMLSARPLTPQVMLDAVEAWLAKFPNDARALRFKAIHSNSLSLVEQSAVSYQRSTKAYPFKTFTFPNWKEHAAALLQFDQEAQAREVIARSVKFDFPNSSEPEAEIALRLIQTLRSVEDEQNAYQLLQKANLLWKNHVGLLLERAVLETTLKQRGKDEYSLSDAQVEAGLKPEAFCPSVPFARQAAQLAPDNFAAQVELLRALHCAGAPRRWLPQGKATFEQIYIAQRATILEAMFLIAQLEKRFEQKDEDFYSVGCEIMTAMGDLGGRVEAQHIELTDRAVAEYPESNSIRWEQVDALKRAGRNAEALARLQESFEISEPNSWAVNALEELLLTTVGAIEIPREFERLLRRYGWNNSLRKAVLSQQTLFETKSEDGKPELRLQSGHQLSPMSLAWSSDGKLVASGGRRSLGMIIDGTIKIWETSSGRLLRTLSGHASGVLSVAFSPDGKTLVSGDVESIVKLWDVGTGRQIWQIKQKRNSGLGSFGYSGHIVSFSPDGRQILSGGNAGVRIIEAQAGRPLPRTICGVLGIFSPDGQSVLTNCGNEIVLWDAVTNGVRLKLGETQHEVNSLAFSPDGNKIAVGTGQYDNSEIYLWTSDGKLVKRISELKKSIEWVGFSPDSRTLFSYDNSDDMQVKMWSADDGSFLRDGEWNSPIFFSRDGLWGATSGGDGWVLWNAKTWKAVRSIQGEVLKPEKDLAMLRDIFMGGGLYSAAFSPDEEYLISGGGGREIEYWNTGNGRLFATGESSQGQIVFSPDGKKILTGIGPVLYLKESPSGSVLKELKTEANALTSAAFNPKKTNQAAVGTDGGLIFLIDTESGTIKQTLESSKNRDARGRIINPDLEQNYPAITSLAYNQDGRFLVAGDSNQKIWIWEVETARLLFPIKKEISRNIHSNERVEYVNAAYTLTAPAAEIIPTHSTNVAFSPDGKTIAVGVSYPKGYDGAVNLWLFDVGTKTVRTRLSGHAAGVNSLAFNKDGRLLVSGSRDNTVRVWEVATGKQMQVFEGHSDDVTSVNFSPKNGDFILSASDDGTLKLWQTPQLQTDGAATTTGREICTLVRMGEGKWAAVKSDGRFDTNNLEEIKGLHWILPDESLTPKPLEIFMRQYFEPGLLSRILKCREEKNCDQEFKLLPSIAEINRVQPVIENENIKILPHKNAPDTVDVEVTVKNATEKISVGKENKEMSSGVYDLRLFRDGQLVGTSAPKEKLEEYIRQAPSKVEEGKTKNIRLNTPEDQEWRKANDIFSLRENVEFITKDQAVYTFKDIKLPHDGRDKIEFSAYAFNADRVKSNTARRTHEIKTPLAVREGKTYLVTIGVNASQNRNYNLRYAANDAREMQKILGERLKATNPNREIIKIPLISDTDANGKLIENTARKGVIKGVFELLAKGKKAKIEKNILDEIKKIAEIPQIQPDDTLIITFSGHGYADQNGIFYMLPYDIGKDTTRLTPEVLRNLISSDELSLWMREVTAKEMLMVVDACHSTAVVGEGFKPGPMGSRGLGQLAYDKDMKILSATQADNVALEINCLRQGLLSYALLQDGIVRAKADKPKYKELFAGEWLSYAEIRVPQLYQELRQGGLKVCIDGKPIDGKVKDVIKDYGLDKNANLQRPSLFDFKKRAENLLLYLP